MIKNECEIVKDLIPNYIENQINDGTKEFVEEHLKNCKGCSEILESLLPEEDVKTEEKEINFLKKYNRKMNILKIIVGVLVMIILVIWAVAGTNYFKKKKQYQEDYEKGKYAYDIINEAYDNIEKIRNSDNYTIIEEYESMDYKMNWEYSGAKKFLYKDGITKKESKLVRGDGHVVNDIVELEVFVDDGLVIADFHREDNAQLRFMGYSRTSISVINPLVGFRKNDVLRCKNYKVREEEYEGIACYVIRTKDTETDTEDIWISKDNKLLIKLKSNVVGDEDIEYKYQWKTNNVTDEDVEMKKEDYDKLVDMLEETKVYQESLYQD